MTDELTNGRPATRDKELLRQRPNAEAKFRKYRSLDPFPSIPPALLNSADIINYIEAIGMVCPYHIDQVRGTTLTLRVGDICVHWDEKEEKVKHDVLKSGEFELKSNSIAYVAIREELRLPAYIIARFNLRVTNAYKGILLGTGPIIDPGYDGRLFIPLHNLTNNNYTFHYNEKFIEMEFTKLSPNPLWSHRMGNGKLQDLEAKTGTYRNWREEAGNEKTEERNIDYYLRTANQGRPINSSLPALETKTKEAIEKATKLSDKVDTSLSRYNVGLLFSFGTLIGAIIAIVNIFKGDIKKIEDKKYEDKIQVLQYYHQRDSIMIENHQRTIDSFRLMIQEKDEN